MAFQKESLDLVLVPSGLLIMFAYHLFLLYRYLNLPHTTVIGYENNDKRAWVERIMQVDKKDVSIPLQVIATNTTAATFLSSLCLTLSSLIGAWIGNSSSNIFQSSLIYGDTRKSTMSIKYITLLTCFLLAFSFFIQSARCFVHANYLISTPDSNIPVKNVEAAVIRGGDFWSLGLRALYFAINLLLWFFGPIPMFVTSVIMVILLYHLDTNSTPLHQHRSPGSQSVKRVRDRTTTGKAMAVERHGENFHSSVNVEPRQLRLKGGENCCHSYLLSLNSNGFNALKQHDLLDLLLNNLNHWQGLYQFSFLRSN